MDEFQRDKEHIEERRADALLMSVVLQDIKTLLAHQAEIKTQVVKTNGRVNVLEKFMWTLLGGAGAFVMFNLPNLIKALNS